LLEKRMVEVVSPCKAVSAVVLAWIVAFPAWAAGGHHAVDDATILDPGACEFETWMI